MKKQPGSDKHVPLWLYLSLSLCLNSFLVADKTKLLKMKC